MTDKEALKMALEALEKLWLLGDQAGTIANPAITALKERLLEASMREVQRLGQEIEQEPVAWISVKDELPKSVRGVSYKSSLTDTVLVLHSDRPDYPITAHAVVGEGLGAGVAIPTDGASEHPEIAWYSASCNLNNPFNLKNDDYERFLPKIFGSKITHWMPIPATPPQRKPLTDEQIEDLCWTEVDQRLRSFARAIEAAHGIKENT
jgi:hypothetical protein